MTLAERYGARLLTVPLDVTDPAQAAGAAAQAVERFGRIDVVVNNAGYADLAPVEEVSPGAFRAQVEAIFFGTVHVTKAALPVFRRQGSGYFIQVTSVGGRLTAPGLGAYQSAKFAVEGFSSVLRQEVAPAGHPHHARRARRDADRLGRFVDGHPGLRPRLRGHRGRDRQAPARDLRHRADRPRQGRARLP